MTTDKDKWYIQGMDTDVKSSKNEASCEGKTAKKSDKTTYKATSRNKPTPRQRTFAKELVLNGSSQRQAAIKAGYSPHTVRRACKDITELPSTQVAIQEVKSTIRADFTLEDQVEGIHQSLEDPGVADNLKLATRLKLYEIIKKTPSHNNPDTTTDTEAQQYQALSLKPVVDILTVIETNDKQA